jgi:exopolysaccharide production protein ExoQ
MLVGVSLLAWPFPREVSLVVPLKGFIVTMLLLSVLVTYGSMDFLLRLVGANKNLTGRTGTWHAVWSAIGDHPWFGYGFDAFWRGIQGPSLAVWQATGYHTPHSHNGFLDLLLGLGFAGLLAFVAAFVLLLKRSFEALQVGIGSARIFPFVYLAMLVFYNLTESSLLGTKSMDWILFTAVAGALPLRTAERRPVGAS